MFRKTGRRGIAQAWRNLARLITFFDETFASDFGEGTKLANSLGNWRARQDSNLRPSA
jgi:hypothetical protein